MNLKSALGMSDSILIISQRKVDYWLLVELQSTAVVSVYPYVRQLMYVDLIADKNWIVK